MEFDNSEIARLIGMIREADLTLLYFCECELRASRRWGCWYDPLPFTQIRRQARAIAQYRDEVREQLYRTTPRALISIEEARALGWKW